MPDHGPGSANNLPGVVGGVDNQGSQIEMLRTDTASFVQYPPAPGTWTTSP